MLIVNIPVFALLLTVECFKMFYRLHSNLTISAKLLLSGSINRLEKLDSKTITKLVNSQVISVVSFPPLIEILEDRAELLEFIGVNNALDFLESCSYDLAEMLNLPNLIIDSWQQDVLDSVSTNNTGCKCGDSRSLKN